MCNIEKRKISFHQIGVTCLVMSLTNRQWQTCSTLLTRTMFILFPLLSRRFFLLLPSCFFSLDKWVSKPNNSSRRKRRRRRRRGKRKERRVISREEKLRFFFFFFFVVCSHSLPSKFFLFLLSAQYFNQRMWFYLFEVSERTRRRRSNRWRRCWREKSRFDLEHQVSSTCEIEEKRNNTSKNVNKNIVDDLIRTGENEDS